MEQVVDRTSAAGVTPTRGRTGKPRIAVVGAGIAGLAAAHRLAPGARVTLFEAGAHFGGHAHTVDVTLDRVSHGVDVGFLVFNHRTYPLLVRLFEALQVPTAPSDMSFSVQAPSLGLEWSGRDLNGVFAQRRRLLSPRFLGMLAQIARFNRLATALAQGPAATAGAESVGDFLDRHRFGPMFRDGYLLPMLGCIWSCPTEQMLRFPMLTLVRFCHNHGLLQLTDRPQWHTVSGGSQRYVRRMLASISDRRLHTPVRSVRRLPPDSGAAGVIVSTDAGSERFDEVVLATHSDQSLALLAEPSAAERAVLGAIRYQPNRAVLHTDTAVLPRSRRAWAAWNYERATDLDREQASVCLHYLINRLQPLPWQREVLVSLNPVRRIDPRQVIGEYLVEHPVFDQAAIAAQHRLPEIQGHDHVWYCGAWTGHGFHEDGLASGLTVAYALQARHAQTVAQAA